MSESIDIDTCMINDLLYFEYLLIETFIRDGNFEFSLTVLYSKIKFKTLYELATYYRLEHYFEKWKKRYGGYTFHYKKPKT
jgi:hypothetical protein